MNKIYDMFDDICDDINNFRVPKNYDSIMMFAETFLLCKEYQNNIWIIGNGGSMATANHFATDIAESYNIPIISLCNISTMSAIANDCGFENVFSKQLERNYRVNDLLLVISGSGNSPNLIKACKIVQQINMHIFGLLGMGGGEVAKYCSEKIIINSNDYGVIESCHSIIGHLIVEYIKERTKKNEN